jgi:hypothetical protein
VIAGQKQACIAWRGTGSAAEQDALDEWLEHEVGDVEVRPDDAAGDEDDDGAGQDLALARPVDLLQLGPALCDEAATSTTAAAAAGLSLRRLGGRANLGLTLARALADALLRLALLLLLLLPVAAALLAGVPGHSYLFSRCTVCLPHQRQYFLASKRSGVFRFDFIV